MRKTKAAANVVKVHWRYSKSFFPRLLCRVSRKLAIFVQLLGINVPEGAHFLVLRAARTSTRITGSRFPIPPVPALCMENARSAIWDRPLTSESKFTAIILVRQILQNRQPTGKFAAALACAWRLSPAWPRVHLGSNAGPWPSRHRQHANLGVWRFSLSEIFVINSTPTSFTMVWA